MVQSFARRSKNKWTVVILNGKEPTFEKRGAAAGQILGSLRPADYQRESFAGRKAGPLNAERIEQMKQFVEMASGLSGVADRGGIEHFPDCLDPPGPHHP